MMQNSLSANARRLFACHELHTMGFQQELLVTMDRGKQRPMTPAEIARETGLSKQRHTDAQAELEAAGLSERHSDDGGPLRNGHILTYSWAVPRPPYVEGQGTVATDLLDTYRKKLPESWKPIISFIKRSKQTGCLKYLQTLDEDSARRYLNEGAEVARRYLEAEKGLREFVEGTVATDRINKEERTERNIERKASAAAAGTVGSIETQPEPEPSPPPPQAPSTTQTQTQNGNSITPVLEALREYGPTITAKQAHMMVAKCKRPGLTHEQIIAVIRHIGDPVTLEKRTAIVLTQVPVFINDEGFDEWLNNPNRAPRPGPQRHMSRSDRAYAALQAALGGHSD